MAAGDIRRLGDKVLFSVLAVAGSVYVAEPRYQEMQLAASEAVADVASEAGIETLGEAAEVDLGADVPEIEVDEVPELDAPAVEIDEVEVAVDVPEIVDELPPFSIETLDEAAEVDLGADVPEVAVDEVPELDAPAVEIDEVEVAVDVPEIVDELPPFSIETDVVRFDGEMATVAGMVAPNETVVIMEGDREVARAQAGADGTFATVFGMDVAENGASLAFGRLLDDGTTEMSDVAVALLPDETATTVVNLDAEGMSVESLDAETISFSGISYASTGPAVLSGLAAAGSKIVATLNGITVGEAIADENGNWEISSSELGEGEHVLGLSIDGAEPTEINVARAAIAEEVVAEVIDGASAGAATEEIPEIVDAVSSPEVVTDVTVSVEEAAMADVTDALSDVTDAQAAAPIEIAEVTTEALSDSVEALTVTATDTLAENAGDVVVPVTDMTTIDAELTATSDPTGGEVAVNEVTVGDTQYRVSRGDSLWRIAERRFGDGFRYNDIYNLNLDKIKDPDLIYPESELTIPTN